MMLNNQRSVERDNQNELRKFPFSDDATCGNGSCEIPPGAIIDAQLYVHGRDPGCIWMSAVIDDGILVFSDADGEFARTAAPPAAHTAVPVTFTGTSGPLPGGVIVFGRQADVVALRALGGQSFSADQAALVPAALTFTGMPGVRGFLLDDGNVVSGAVKIRGENGCDVSTYVKDNVNYLRISAIGKTVSTTGTATGFITSVVCTSDNSAFTVGLSEYSDKAVNILATGVRFISDAESPVDQNDVCAAVRTRVGSVPSERATPSADCDDGICPELDATDITPYTITLVSGDNGEVTIGTLTRLVGNQMGQLLAVHIPTPPAGQRFVGYFDNSASERIRYQYDGSGVGTFDVPGNITLYAKFMAATSTATVTFSGYGTLHLNAPNTDDGYDNPIRISGLAHPIPSIREIPERVIEEGGPDAITDILLHPTVPDGEVHIGLRGSNKLIEI